MAAFANSAGQRLAGRTTTAMLDGIARTGTSDGSRPCGVRSARGPGRRRGRREGHRAARATPPTPPTSSPARYEVVLAPSTASSTSSASWRIYGFNGRAVEEGRSFARLGEAQFDAIDHSRR